MALIVDAVLLQQGNQSLVERGREIRSNSSGFKVLGKSITKPLDRFSKDGIIRYIISLPLNSIPIVGTALFLLYNGAKAGPGFHARYFQLKNFDKTTRQSFVGSRRAAYTAWVASVHYSYTGKIDSSSASRFGAVALGLNLVPVVGLLFNITSTIGAALWANKLEKTQATEASSGRKVNHPGESANDVPIRDTVRVQTVE